MEDEAYMVLYFRLTAVSCPVFCSYLGKNLVKETVSINKKNQTLIQV